MKIVLVYPYMLEDRIHEEDVRVVPIGLYYIGAFLIENGYEVDIFNAQELRDAPEKIREMIAAAKPDVMGFSVMNANRWGAVDIARMAKSMRPETPVIFGGPAATFLWEHFLAHHPEVDYTVMGEGEQVFLELVRCIETGDRLSAASIPGIGCRENGNPRGNGMAPVIEDLDSLPNPARYFTYHHVALTRGCPSDCTFCGSPKLWGRRVRFHSADYFVEQIQLLHDKGVRFFFVSDDTFTLKKSRVIGICRKIIEQRLSIAWAAISRVDCVDEEILSWMRRAGCIQISYGVESGAPRIRRFFNKPLSDQAIERAFSLTTRYGIFSRAYFIYGSPGENWETIQETLDLMKVIRPLAAVFYVLDVFPGTALYEEFKQRFGLTDEIWRERIEDILYYEYDPFLTKDAVMAFGKTLRNSFYENLPGFAENLEVTEDPSFAPLHADFFSRLAMTFTHGDYARISEIPEKDQLAEILYTRSLGCCPNHRAYWGLSLLYGSRADWDSAIRISEEGLRHFPESPDLHLCMAAALMNRGEFSRAMSFLAPYRHLPHFLPYIAQCQSAMEKEPFL